MKFKVGDRIKCTKFVDDNGPGYITLGKEYIVKSTNGLGDHDDMIAVMNNINMHWWIRASSCSLFKKELINELDFLNAFQENFKEGI